MSAIASGMVPLTGIVFALAFVMVQFSAVAYSPRLVAWFGRDPMLFHSLGLFTATFLYAIAALAWTDRGGNGKVPLFSVLLIQVAGSQAPAWEPPYAKLQLPKSLEAEISETAAGRRALGYCKPLQRGRLLPAMYRSLRAD